MVMSAEAFQTTGMVLASPADAQELLQLCTVMGWKPRLPLHIMRDEMAKRWFLKGEPGKQDYWIRDMDIQALKATPMWNAVRSAKPYGMGHSLGDEPIAKARMDTREAFMQIIDDPINDPVEQDRLDLARPRLEAEERLRKADEWE